MNIEVVKSKIHRVTITESDLNYVGSITIDLDLMEASNLIANEKVHYTHSDRLVNFPLPDGPG